MDFNCLGKSIVNSKVLAKRTKVKKRKCQQQHVRMHTYTQSKRQKKKNLVEQEICH